MIPGSAGTVRTFISAALVTLAVARPAGMPQRPSAPDLASVLNTCARYLDQYERDVTAVIAREEYQQNVSSERLVRRLKSDLLILADAEWGWVEFRDVYEVDGQPLRDHDERIARLFMKPNANALQQARRIANEGARFNLSPGRAKFNRTLNVPLTALRFLRRQGQPRSTFTVVHSEPSRVTLTFRERVHPRLIGTRDEVASEGTFVVDPASGRILSTDLSVPSSYAYARFKVEYVEQTDLKLWLPATFVESYNIPGNAMLDGRATYSNFRMFRVETSTTIGK